MRSIVTLVLVSILVATSFLNAENKSVENQADTAEELGKVKWLRDYDEALSIARKEKKQVLILFQEVPGCSTCRNYGKNVLSNPLMVEAIEEYFVPLAIFNNKGGKDREVLDRYKEPTWNNPVVRIVNSEGKDEVARLAANYSAIGLYQSMDKALKSANISTAAYFKLLGEELRAKKEGSVQETYFKMYCFWSGEGHLGQHEGVLSTEPGFMGGHEVVKVKYDETKVSKEELQAYAAKAQCSKIEKKEGYRVDKDPQYYLKKSSYRYLPLSPVQRTKINSALAIGKDPKYYLSPKQLKWFNEKGKEKKVLYEKPFREAWELKTSTSS